MTKDMTKGSPTKLILLFAIPLIIGNVFQQLYNMVDTVIVGRTIGLDALSAVGATGSVSFMIVGFVTGVTSGFSVLIAQYFGAGDYNNLRRSVAMSITLSAIITVIITFFSMFFAYDLLKIMNTPSDIIGQSYDYLIVIFGGIFATVFYNLISNIIRALGDSRTPLIFLIIGSIVNIFLDFLFIKGFSMGVGGAGYATVLSQLISGFMCLIYAKRKLSLIHVKIDDFKFSASFAYEHLKVGLPMAFQFSITALGVMVLQSVLNTFGTVTIGAFTTASKVEQLVSQFFPSMGTTIATFAAQNYGAKQYSRIKDGVRKSLIITVIYSVFASSVMIFLGRFFLRLFIGADDPNIAQVTEQAQIYFNVNGIFLVVMGIIFIYRNVLQGIGKPFFPLAGGVAELTMRIVTAKILVIFIGYLGVCLAGPIAWFGADLMLIPAYYIISSRFPSD